MIRLDVPRFNRIRLYLKDESTHPTGSLKHRLARSLIQYGLCSGRIVRDTTLVEASSGSTAVSTAYFAQLLGLPFLAVVPSSTATAKIDAIRYYGGDVHFVDEPRLVYRTALELARERNGHFLDQFTYAERATDWRRDNIADSIFTQLAREPDACPSWVVCGAGTGGTSATIGRYTRYKRLPSRLCIADPVNSVFHHHYQDRSVLTLNEPRGSIIEGIGRASVEPSFMPDVIDRVVPVDDAQSIGAMRALSTLLGRPVGGSTGTNLSACAELIAEMAARGETGAIITILCDSGSRYADTYFDDAWLKQRDIDWEPHAQRMFEMLT